MKLPSLHLLQRKAGLPQLSHAVCRVLGDSEFEGCLLGRSQSYYCPVLSEPPSPLSVSSAGLGRMSNSSHCDPLCGSCQIPIAASRQLERNQIPEVNNKCNQAHSLTVASTLALIPFPKIEPEVTSRYILPPAGLTMNNRFGVGLNRFHYFGTAYLS